MKDMKQDIAARVREGMSTDMLENEWDPGHSGLIKPLILLFRIEQETDMSSIHQFHGELNYALLKIKPNEEGLQEAISTEQEQSGIKEITDSLEKLANLHLKKEGLEKIETKYNSFIKEEISLKKEIDDIGKEIKEKENLLELKEEMANPTLLKGSINILKSKFNNMLEGLDKIINKLSNTLVSRNKEFQNISVELGKINYLNKSGFMEDLRDKLKSVDDFVDQLEKDGVLNESEVSSFKEITKDIIEDTQQARLARGTNDNDAKTLTEGIKTLMGKIKTGLDAYSGKIGKYSTYPDTSKFIKEDSYKLEYGTFVAQLIENLHNDKIITDDFYNHTKNMNDAIKADVESTLKQGKTDKEELIKIRQDIKTLKDKLVEKEKALGTIKT